jgi:FlaA1/EpsC-like NDP-sugar epimerase
MEQRKTGVLPITDPPMTRFNISLQDGVEMVLWAIEHVWGGEVLVPKIPFYHITDVALAIDADCDHKIIGLRPGEKVHEEMITSSDSFNVVDIGRYYAILPAGGHYSIEEYCEKTGAQAVTSGFSYDRSSNEQFLSAVKLRCLVQTQMGQTGTL